MKDQFISILEELRNVNLATSPNYITMKALANHPEAYYPNPEVVAASVKINVSYNFVEDTELFNKTVDLYVKTLSQFYSQVQADFPRNGVANQVFTTMIGQMGLDLTYTF